jgi:hypothetical protein
MSYILYHTILSKYYFRGLNQNSYVKLGNGHFSTAKKIGVDILAPTSKDNLAPFTCILDRTI